MTRTKGDRVGAILSADKTTVNLLGYGTYEGEEVPPTGFYHECEISNPKIKLDSGAVVWGYQCWWSGEEHARQIIGGRNVVVVTMPEEAVAAREGKEK